VRQDGHPANELLCSSCAAATTRQALLTQIADETVRETERFLERLRAARGRSPAQ
jgi:hypothetical protein